MKLFSLIAGLTFLGTASAFETLGVDQKSGIVEVGPNSGDKMFYWMFYAEENKDTAPLVMWLTGGPGCASEVAVFMENGPYKIDKAQNMTLNPSSWHKAANMIYVDNPIGTGFSPAASEDDFVTSEDGVAEGLHAFLRNFVKENPEFEGRDFYITGESYAGHYIPAISYELVENGADTGLNFKGSAIGNGWVNPYVQYPEYAKFSLENGLIDEATHTQMVADFKTCQDLVKNSPWYEAFPYCQSIVAEVIGNPPKFNVYNIKEPCSYPPLCYDMSPETTFCNDIDNQAQLGITGKPSWETCNMDVHSALMGDWTTNMGLKIPAVLAAGKKVLVYSGDYDYICNWRGGEAWTKVVEWEHQEDFNTKAYDEWSVAGKPAGQVRQHENLAFLRVYHAGHMVPLDQAENALAMFKAFITEEIKPELSPIMDTVQE
jgi:cathepsin A (carboxypeptidase C)